MDITLKIIGIFTAVVTIFALIIKGVALVRTTRIERVILSDQKRITTYIIETILISIVSSLVLTICIHTFEPDKRPEVAAAIFLALIVGILILSPTIYAVVTMFRKKIVYYIEDKDSGEVYFIQKVNTDGDLILSRKPKYDYKTPSIIVQKKDYLYGKEIKSRQL